MCVVKWSKLRYWWDVAADIFIPRRYLHALSICIASLRFRKRHVASRGKKREFSFRRSKTRASFLRADKILSCWDESWELYRTRKTHQFPGISDRSILQRQQHHCAQSHWRWRMKTPFNNIAYSSASAPVQTFFVRGEMIDCARAHGDPQSKLHPRCRSICRGPLVYFAFRATARVFENNNTALKFALRWAVCNARYSPRFSSPHRWLRHNTRRKNDVWSHGLVVSRKPVRRTRILRDRRCFLVVFLVVVFVSFPFIPPGVYMSRAVSPQSGYTLRAKLPAYSFTETSA